MVLVNRTMAVIVAVNSIIKKGVTISNFYIMYLQVP